MEATMFAAFRALISAAEEAAAAAAEKTVAAATDGFFEGDFGQKLIDLGLKLIGVVVLFIVGRWVARKVGRVVEKSLKKKDFDKTLTKFFATVASTLVLIMVVLACLSIFGIATTSVAAILGAAGLAIGLAFQGSLSNFAAGIMLIVFRPYNVGDVVKIAGEVGKVDELGLFVTVLDTPDNRRIMIPNGKAFDGVIENITHHELRRVDVPVGTDYSKTVDETRAILQACIADVPGRVEGQPHAAYLAELGASSVDWEVRVWCNAADWFDVREQTIRAIKNHLDAADIGIPFPQMDVHLDKIA